MRKKLCEMSADEALSHYRNLMLLRTSRISEEMAAVSWSPVHANTKRRLMNKLRKAMDKAEGLNVPRQHWQVAAAKRIYEQHGVNAAVGWLRAYGWPHSREVFREVTGKHMVVESLGDCLLSRLKF
jgi:hypothetical protein